MKEIEIIIGKDGEVTFDLDGYKGKGCSEIAEKFSKALGKTVKSDKKCEFYQSEVQNKQQIKQ